MKYDGRVGKRKTGRCMRFHVSTRLGLLTLGRRFVGKAESVGARGAGENRRRKDGRCKRKEKKRGETKRNEKEKKWKRERSEKKGKTRAYIPARHGFDLFPTASFSERRRRTASIEARPCFHDTFAVLSFGDKYLERKVGDFLPGTEPKNARTRARTFLPHSRIF